MIAANFTALPARDAGHLMVGDIVDTVFINAASPAHALVAGALARVNRCVAFADVLAELTAQSNSDHCDAIGTMALMVAEVAGLLQVISEHADIHHARMALDGGAQA